MTEPPAGFEDATPRRGAAFWAVLGVGLAVGLANVPKPVHIDDTLYLSIARRIVEHPLDPYGGTVNWQQFPEPTYNVSLSPPLLSYYFALPLAVAGENLLLLHVLMMPWVLLACWALYRLGERWADAGAATALLVVLGPAVTVGLNLMLDVPLLACVCAAVECLMRGVERGSARWTVAAGALGAIGVGIKFPALALIPVFAAVAVRRRRWGPLLAASGPVLALVAWQMASRSLYGASQVHAGLSFLDQFRTTFVRQIVERTPAMFAILAWTFPLWMLAPSGLRRRGWFGGGLAAILAMAIAGALLGSDRWQYRPWVSAAFLIGVGLGTFGCVAGVLSGRLGGARRTDDPRPVLWAWIAGVAAIVIPFGPFIAVRSFLPIQPPLVILLLSRHVATRRAVGVTIGMTAALGAALAAVDVRWAACYPAAARQIRQRYGDSGRPILFSGHWGWQYYAQREGFQPWDARWRSAPTGAIVVVPARSDLQWIHPEVARRFRLLDRITVPPHPLRLTTWNRAAGIRFYGGDYGELPWGLSSGPTEEFFIFAIGPPVHAFSAGTPPWSTASE